jgi:hypothetical protein
MFVRLEWAYRVKNGGYVKVMNKETSTEETFFYEGQESTASYMYHFDTVKPSSSSDEPLVAPDITDSVGTETFLDRVYIKDDFSYIGTIYL